MRRPPRPAGDHRADLGRADVECGDQGLVGGLRPSVLQRLAGGWSAGGDRLAGRARQADDHLARNAHVEADEAAAEQAGLLVDLRELDRARLAPASSPSGSATVSPDWKLMSQRRPPTQVAEASCGLSVGAAWHQPRRARRHGRWRPGRSAAAGRASRRPERGPAPRRRQSISASCWLFCQIAAGLRSTMSMTSVSGSRRDTRASLIQPKRSSRSRIAATSTSACGALAVPPGRSA